MVLTGVTGLRNRGVEALVLSCLDGIRSVLPDPAVTVVTDDPEFDAWRLAGRASVAWDSFTHESGVRRLAGTARRVLGREHQADRAAIDVANVVVVTGGDLFGPHYGAFEPRLRHLQHAARRNRSYVLLAQSIGPFSSPDTTQRFVKVARRAAHITVRERTSLDYILDDLGLPATAVTLTADPALLLPSVDSPAVRRILDSVAHGSRRLVGIAPSAGVPAFARLDRAEHAAAWTTLIERIITMLDVDIIIIPHVQERQVANDDSVLALQLQQAVASSRVTVAAGQLAASEYKTLVARCDLVISERTHAAIAGLSQEVPTFSIGYSIKAHGIARDLLADLSSAYTCSVTEFVDSGSACIDIPTLVTTASEARATLRARLPDAVARAKSNFEIVARVARMSPNRDFSVGS